MKLHLAHMMASTDSFLLSIIRPAVIFSLWMLAGAETLADDFVRPVSLLTGTWQFRANEETAWKDIELPASFEAHEGEEFDGIGWYRRTLPLNRPDADHRLLLRFHGAATEAQVFCNGQRVGDHLGGWTPFECDLTTVLANGDNEILVRVDEKVGHNSQGFLPVFAPHFGGLWQDVELLTVPDVRLDDLHLAAQGDIHSGLLQLHVPLISFPSPQRLPTAIEVHVRQRGNDRIVASDSLALTPAMTQQLAAGQDLNIPLALAVPNFRLWSPANPALYDVQISLLQEAVGDRRVVDQIHCRAAFRDVRVDGDRLLLNGQPLQVRGVLNWGYAPPRTAPSLEPQFWKQEIELAQAYGFNLIKFCLWVPPRGYLEMADEMGMLTWMEYPTWHSQWTPDQLPTLQREFTEFFHYDRNHPSVVLRSLTCETGPSADLTVIRSLYDLCHAMIPGAIVEDDSSWIEWNRVHDFYDDHPYGNNHTWLSTLTRLKQHVQTHGIKPLVLGEAIAADTWADPDALIRITGDARPFWLPNFIDANQAWLADRQRDMGREATARLQQDSLNYAMLMRKFQIETFRREVSSGGYVVSVIRDFPFAGMGLLDFQGQPKWNAAAWNWHGPTCLILQTEEDRRSFDCDGSLNASILISHFGPTHLEAGQLQVALSRSDSEDPKVSTDLPRWSMIIPTGPVDIGTSGLLSRIEIPLHEVCPKEISQPIRFVVSAQLQLSDGEVIGNEWPVWVCPVKTQASETVLVDSSFPLQQARSLFEKSEPLESDTAIDAQAAELGPVILARHFSAPLLDRLEHGSRVLMLPDGEPGSFPRAGHWFLRGGPIVAADEAVADQHDLLVELQHFDLAGPVVPDLQWLDQLQPLVMLWDNHDIDRVKTHGLVFAAQVGKGRLLVSSLNHEGSSNSAGRWLLHRYADLLQSSEFHAPVMQPSTVQAIRGKLSLQKIDLTERPWTFRVDADNNGLQRGWHRAVVPEPDEWKPMSIGRHWEGLGYESLDGWAWYRIDVPLPDSWQGEPTWICIEGADDHYELYVNGQLAGSGGVIETKQTAFEDRNSHDVSALVGDDRVLRIAIRVYDWYGAGGLFRPISVRTVPLTNAAEIIR
ncbi:MAG: hypothetical protein KDA85_10515 [Planctomycetaceae bacterium]|nr:hypothetical protein [Planctomycetaceae bacterium]